MQTAPSVNANLGWAVICHPYHPLHGRRFEVLGERRVAGVDSLVLRQSADNAIRIAREWTDWADPSIYEMLGWPAGHFDAKTLLELVTVVEHVRGRNKKC